MDFNATIRKLSARRDPAGTTVTLALNLSKSGRLPAATRVFLKDQVYKNLASEARPERAREPLRKLSRRIRDFVEREVRPETDGLFLVAGPEFWEALELRVPLRNLITVGSAPYLAPLVEAARRAPRAYLVDMDAREARIEEIHLGERRREFRLAAPAVADDVEGASPRGGAERDLHQRRRTAASKALARETAARTAALHRESPAEAILLARPSGEFLDHLPAGLRGHVLPLGKGWAETLEAAGRERVEREVEEFRRARARGLRAALGPRDVLEALAAGRVERVFVNPDDPCPGVVCADCGARFPRLRLRCVYCGGDVEAASMTQEILTHALLHPPLELSFVPAPADWLRELGGLAALLSAKGARRSRSANGVLVK